MKLKEIRKDKGIMPKRLAKELGIKVTTYYAKENGTRKFSAEEIQKVCKVLDINISDISF